MIDTKSIYPVKYKHYFPTGIDAIDGHLNGGGLWEREIVVLGGRAGMGKTAVAAQIAVNIAKCDVPVMFISLEKSQEVLLYFAGEGEKDEYKLSSLQLVYPLMPTISTISEAIWKSDARVVIIDYAQLIDLEGHDFGEAMHILPHGRAYLIASQLSRDVVDREGHLPKIKDCTKKLKYSDQHATILLHMDSYYDGTPSEEMEVFVYRGDVIRGHGHWIWSPKDFVAAYLKAIKEGTI